MAKKPPADATPAVPEKKKEYLVLARKYRPQNFSELKGQDALVRTLSNAIQSGRLAHAFMLTGVRGVGKTTTARIIARALNCEKGPTVTPCGVCEQCRAIAEDRHVDVLEMDAASKNGVEDIRVIIDSVQYAPVSGRYKIFILDEVHMLSKAAFNALLKTLEEPPEHVKFVFATTEIRKVPVTVLSRCQRFDLRRVGAEVLQQHFRDILSKEKVTAEDGAVSLIARAADGSVRDGLSLLDQAISREPGAITERQAEEMLGLVDRSVTLDLFDAVMKGESETALGLLDSLYKGGADPLMTLQDLLDLTHTLTKIKVAPEIVKDLAMPEAERVRGAALAKALSVPVLTRAWQILMKGIPEIQQAFHPQSALEMLVIRLLFASDQPTPADLLKRLKDGSVVSAGAAVHAPSSSGGGTRTIMSRTSSAALSQPLQEEEIAPQAATALQSFEDVVALFGQKREAMMQASLVSHVHLVKFEAGHISLRLAAGAPQNLAGKIAEKLSDWTQSRWVVSLSREEGAPTIAERRASAEKALRAEVENHAAVKEALKIFPGAKIIRIHDKKED